MTKKKLWFSAGLYTFCTLLWAVNFFLHWHQDGSLTFSTALFGLAAVCFGISAVLNFIRIRRMKGNKEE